MTAFLIAAVTSKVNILWIFKFKGRVEDIFGNVDQDRSRPACRSDVEGLFQDPRQFFDVLYEIIVFSNGRRDAGNVSFLKGIAADEWRRDLTADDNQGNRIHIGRRNAGHHVADSRAGSCKADSGAPRHSSITVGSVNSSLFMSRQNMRELRFI